MSSKVNKREVFALYFKHIHMLLLFLGFSGKSSTLLLVKVKNVGSYSLFDPLDQAGDQANLRCF